MWKTLRKSKLVQKIKGSSDKKKYTVSKNDAKKKKKKKKKTNDVSDMSILDDLRSLQMRAANDEDFADKKSSRKNSARPSGGTDTNQEGVNASEFTSLRVLGTGGYGVVYKVQHHHSKLVFALKVIDKGFAASSDFRCNQTLAEREVMSQVQHPHLLPLYAAFQDDDDLFMLMPEMRGGDLAEFLTNVGLMSEGMCRFYAAEIVLAFEYLHGKGIIFRDLKPSNILMNSAGHIMLSDYGLCVTKTAGMKDLAGTVGYMAPEALGRQQPAPSFDVWTFGATIYKLMTGHRPFRSTRSIIYDPLKFKGEIAQNLSVTTQDLLIRLLDKDPSTRLGCGDRGWSEIKEHPFFKGIEWEEISISTAPYVPSKDDLNSLATKTSSVLPEPDEPREKLDAQTTQRFDGWSFNTHKCKENAFIWSSPEDPSVSPSASASISSVTASPASTSSTRLQCKTVGILPGGVSPCVNYRTLNPVIPVPGTKPGSTPECSPAPRYRTLNALNTRTVAVSPAVSPALSPALRNRSLTTLTPSASPSLRHRSLHTNLTNLAISNKTNFALGESPLTRTRQLKTNHVLGESPLNRTRRLNSRGSSRGTGFAPTI